MKIVGIAVAAVALAGGIVLAGPASPASADVPPSISVQYVTGYFWGAVYSVPVVGIVSCPSGTRVVSSGAGGAELGGIAPNWDFTSVTATGRIDRGYLQVTVGCAPAAQLTEVTSTLVELPTGSGPRRGVVYCPTGMRAFGGGGYIAEQYFGAFSQDSSGMVSNTVSADGTGWAFAAYTNTATDRVVVRTQCAPLRGSLVSQTGTSDVTLGGSVYGSCPAGYTALSGGVYLSRADGSEETFGAVNWSVPANDNRWYVSGTARNFPGNHKLVALEQCIR
jgi:hypothetical protein